MAEKINPSDFGFSQKEWKKLNAQIKEWISLNKELWNNMTAYEKQFARNQAKSSKSIKMATQGYEDIQDITKKIHDNLKGSAATNKLNATIVLKTQDISKKYFKESEKGKKADKLKLKSWKGIVDLSQDFMINQDAIGTDEFRSLDVNKQIRDTKKAGNVEQLEYLENLKLEHDIQKKLNNEINVQADLIKKPFGILDDMVKRIPVVGDMLSAKLDLTGKGQDMADKFIESARDAISGAKGEVLGWNAFQKSKKGKGMDSKTIAAQYKEHKKGAAAGKKGMAKMGVGALAVGTAIVSWGVAQFNFARELGISFSELSVGAVLFKEETKAILDEFGSLRDVSNGLLFNMKWQAFWSGAQATDMAKVMMLQQSITTDTKAMALDRQAKFMKEIRKEGLSSSKIMGDLASHADMFANFAKDGGKNMEEAAKQAAKMGLSLDATSSVAESLLDWETSIGKEMEASVLLGRSINLDKARSLAYSGDLAAMMTEVKNQAGGEAEFAKMSVIQRQTLGDAIGLQGAQLAEFMKTEEQRTKELNNSLWKKLGIFTGIAIVLGALVGMIVVGIKGIKGSIDLKRGALQGMGYGLGAGVAGSAAYATYAKGKAEGGPVKAGSPYIVGERGSELFVPMTSGNIIPHMQGGTVDAYVDNSSMETKLDQLISIAAKQPTSELVTDQARRQRSATQDAFIQR